jgi:hypothetical protein
MSTPHYNDFKVLPKALTFDVFGTVGMYIFTILLYYSNFRASIKLVSHSCGVHEMMST